MSNKTSFKTGMIVGAVLGGIASFFLSPRSGKENRELAKRKFEELRLKFEEGGADAVVKEIFGSVTAEGRKLYLKARDEVNSRLDEMQATLKDIDKAKYKELVQDSMAALKEEGSATKERLSKLQDYLMKRWDTAREMAKEDVKKAKEKKTVN